MQLSTPQIVSTCKLPVLAMLILGSMILSGCSEQSAKEKADAEETTVVDTMKQKATEAKTASSDMLDKAKEMAGDAQGDAVDKAKDAAKDQMKGMMGSDS